MIKYFTIEQVLFLHSRLISETGGMHGVRDLGMLQSALGRPSASFDGVDLYPDIMAKAAEMMDSLARNHPFVDGNKRTAIAATALFLRRNGYRLQATQEEIVTFTLSCAMSRLSFDAMEDWFRTHSILL